MTVPGMTDKIEGRLTTPLADVAEVPAGDLKFAAANVSGMIPGNSLLSLVVRGSGGKSP